MNPYGSNYLEKRPQVEIDSISSALFFASVQHVSEVELAAEAGVPAVKFRARRGQDACRRRPGGCAGTGSATTGFNIGGASSRLKKPARIRFAGNQRSWLYRNLRKAKYQYFCTVKV
jgi:hypothetical protein